MKLLLLAASLFSHVGAELELEAGVCNAISHGVGGPDSDLAILGYYGPVGAMSPMVGAHPMHHGHPAHHPAHGVPPLPYPPAVAARMFNPSPGAPQHGARFQPLPLITGAFVAAGLTSQPFSQTPQRQFMGRRLTYTETRTGVSATGLTTISQLAVGQTLQFVGAGAIGGQSFQPGAYDTDVRLDPCGPGVNITGQVNVSSNPANADRIDFSLGLWGESLG